MVAVYRVTGTYRQEGTGTNTARAFVSLGRLLRIMAQPHQSTHSIDVVAAATSATLGLQSYGTAGTIAYVRQHQRPRDQPLVCLNPDGRADDVC